MASLREFISEDAELEILEKAWLEQSPPISEEEKQNLIHDMSFEEHMCRDDPGATPKNKIECANYEGTHTSSARAAASSSTTATTPSGVRKAIAKRDFGRKHSAESDTHKRDLTYELEAARDKDKELMTDAEMAGADSEVPPAPAAQQSGGDFWRR